jgi:hypothetical protein
MLDDAQRVEVEELVGRLVPELVAAEVARLLPKLVVEQVAMRLAEQSAALGIIPSPPPQTDRVPQTVWEGDREMEFVFDPPHPRRHTFLLARGTSSGSSGFHVRQYIRSATSALTVAEDYVLSYDGSPDVIIVPPGVTHLGVHPTYRYGWRVVVADPDGLPTLELPAAGEHAAVFAHRLGAMPAALKSAGLLDVHFYQPCDCPAECEQETHQQPTKLAYAYKKRKAEFVFPAEQGIVHIDTREPWSLKAKG